MKLKTSLSLALIALLTHENLAAEVNTQEGSFNWRKSEMLIASPSERLFWERSYSSRSEMRGLLGLGWCTEFEWRLSFAEGEAWLQKCDDAERIPASRIRRQKSETWVKEGGHELIFSTQGELRGFRTSGNGAWLLQRDPLKRPSGLLSPKGTLAVFRYDELRHLEKISTPQAKWTFRFEKNLLAEVRSDVGETESYEYDRSANLTGIRSGAKRTVAAAYDETKDIVESVEEANCRSRYTYKSLNGADFVNDQVLETRTCMGRSPRLIENNFRYAKLPGNRARLLERTSRIDGE